MGGHRRRAESHLHDPGQLAVLQRDLRHRPDRFANDGCVCRLAGLLWHDGRLGLRGVGYRLLLPAVPCYRGAYPIYYPHYPTYGYAAAYNPWTGTYARGAVAYGPYGGAGYAAAYNPRTGTYARGAVAYGPYGAAGAAQAYNPRTGAYGQTRQGANPYGSWGSTSVARGDQWASTQRTTNNATGVTTRTTQSSAGSSARVTGPGGSTAAVGKSNSGDLYAGHDGNVYKKDSSGGYQKYRQRQLEQRAAAHPGAEAAGAVPGQLPRGRRRCQLSDDESGPERRGGAHSGSAAHEYLQPRRRRQQLSPERRWRRPAKVAPG